MDKLPMAETINSGWLHWLIKNTPSCKEAAELASRSLDQAIPVGVRIKLRLHFLICRWCERYFIHMRFLRRAMRHYARRSEQEGPALSPDARRRLKQALNCG